MQAADIFEIRAGVQEQYPDVLTAEALNVMAKVAHLDGDRKAVMQARLDRRRRRSEQGERIGFLDPNATIGRTSIQVADARAGGIFGRLRYQLGVEIDAEPARAAFRRLDDDAPVSRTQVNEVVVLAHLGHAQHPLDNLHRRLYVGHRAVIPRPCLTLGVRRERGHKQ